MNYSTDILFIVPAFKPKMKTESIGTLILAKKAIINGYNAEIARYWNVKTSPEKDYLTFRKEFTDFIIRKRSKIVSFYCRCEEYHVCIDLAQHIKKLSPTTIIVFGGPQAELVAKETIKAFGFIDYVCCSEGENTIVPLLNWIIDNHEDPKIAHQIPGLTYRTQIGTIIQNSLPDFLPDNYCREYSYYDLIPQQVWDKTTSVAIDVGRGCPFSCTFCSTKTFWKRKYRLRNMDNIITELQYLIDNHGITTFDFKHDLFTVNKNRILHFCDGLNALGTPIHWGCDSRIGVVDAEMIDRMVQSGLTNIFFGIESGSKKMQSLINKHLNLDEADTIIRYCLEKGLKVTTSFIYGFPEETEDSLSDTIKLAVQFQNYGCNVLTNLCHITNGTELFTVYGKSLKFIDNTDFNQCIIGLDQLKGLITDNINMFASLCDYPNPLRKEMSYLDAFRFALNYAYRNMPDQHSKLLSHDYASLALYREFCIANNKILGINVPSSDGNVTTTRKTLKHIIDDCTYELLINNLINRLKWVN